MKLNFWQIVGLALVLVGIIGIIWAKRAGNGSETEPTESASPTAPATQQATP